MNRFAWRMLVPLAVLLALGASKTASAQENFQAVLRGFHETPTNVSTGRGRLDLTISADASSISYTLTYPSVPGGVTQAHIHIGEPAIAGGIVLFFCTNLSGGPAGTQACPTPSGQVSGTWTAADVVDGAVKQGVPPGDFKDVLRAIRAGAAYANIHSVVYPPGEIRGTIVPKP